MGAFRVTFVCVYLSFELLRGIEGTGFVRVMGLHCRTILDMRVRDERTELPLNKDLMDSEHI